MQNRNIFTAVSEIRTVCVSPFKLYMICMFKKYLLFISTQPCLGDTSYNESSTKILCFVICYNSHGIMHIIFAVNTMQVIMTRSFALCTCESKILEYAWDADVNTDTFELQNTLVEENNSIGNNNMEIKECV